MEQFNALKKQQQEWEFFKCFDVFLENNPGILMFYDKLSPTITEIEKDIYVGGCASYILFNHPMWILVGVNDTLIPFSISLLPQVLIDKNDIFTDAETIVIKKFIMKNFYALSEYAKMNIDLNILLSFLNRKQICEGMLLTEMPVLTSDETGLPTNIWIDGERKMQHGPRLKFKSSDSDNTRTWSTCTINDNPQIKNLPNNTTLNSNDLNKIISFVTYNKELLLDLADGITDHIKSEDILKRLVKIGKNGGPIYSREMFDEPLCVSNSTPINVYIDTEHNGLTFIFNGEEANVKRIVKMISQNQKFKYSTPYSVTYTKPQYEPSGFIDWRSKMKALTQLKELANNNGFNVKFQL